MKKSILFIVGMLCMSMPTYAQLPSSVQPLTIGDAVPDIAFTNIIKYSNTKAELSDFRGKLVILDFWSTWCGACLALFPHMDSLQKKFGDQIQIILVNTKSKETRDTEVKIRKVFERMKNSTGITVDLPVVYDCEELDSYFPCKYIPHEVWIDGSGKVAAITSSAEVTYSNIQALLDGKHVNMRLKKDFFDFDSNQPLFVNGNGGDGNDFIYRSIITGYKEGLGHISGYIPAHDKGKISRLYFLNYTLLDLYKAAYRRKMTFPLNRTIIEVSDPHMLQGSYQGNQTYLNSYCYEVTLSPTGMDQVLKYMQQDLFRSFHITVKEGMRLMKCLIVTAGDKKIPSFSREGKPEVELRRDSDEKHIYNYPIDKVVQILNEYSPIPLISEINLSKNIDIELPINLSDTASVIRALERSGFDVTESQRDLDVIVFTDAPVQ